MSQSVVLSLLHCPFCVLYRIDYFHRYKDIVNEAIANAKYKPHRCIIHQRRNVHECSLTPGFDIDWDDALSHATPHPCVPVESNHPLYLLYTSGTTGQPFSHKSRIHHTNLVDQTNQYK
jgi:acyl-coenzyme A synthetase/AMP-(fatty) acid ligase